MQGVTDQFDEVYTQHSIRMLQREFGDAVLDPGLDFDTSGIHEYSIGDYSAIITTGIDVSSDVPSGMATVANQTGIPLERYLNVVGVGHTNNVAKINNIHDIKTYEKDPRFKSFFGKSGWEYDGVIFYPSLFKGESFIAGNRYADCPVAVGYIDLIDGQRFCFVQHESAHAIGNGAIEALQDSLYQLGEIADTYVFILPGATAIEWERSKLLQVVLSNLRSTDKQAYFKQVTLDLLGHRGSEKVLYNNVLDSALRWSSWLKFASPKHSIRLFGVNSMTHPWLHSYRASSLGLLLPRSF